MWYVVRNLSTRGLSLLIVSNIFCSASAMIVGVDIVDSDALGVTGPRAVEADQEANDVYLHTQGQLIEQEFSSDSVHSYQVELDSGQYLSLVLEQRGIDIGVALYRPDGRMLTGFGCRQDGPTPVSLIAEASGTYLVKLRALEKEIVHGRYTLRVKEIRLATARDKTRIAGERAFAGAEKLKTEWTAESSRKAIRKYEEAVAYWKAAGEKREEANGLRIIGEVYHLLGNAHKALGYFSQARQLSNELGDQKGESEALNGIGSVYLQLGENEKALEHCTKSLNLIRGIGNHRGEALALNGIGDVYYFSGDREKFLSYYNQALPLWQTLNDRRGLAQTLMYIGVGYTDSYDEDQALKYLDRALAIWQALNHRPGQASTIRLLAHVYSKLGEKQKALNLFDQARELFRPMGDHAAEAALLNGMGHAYLQLGEHQKALGYFNQALRLYQSLSFPGGEGDTLMLLGRCYFAIGDNQNSLKCFQRALSVFRALSDRRQESVVIGEIGRVHESIGDRNKALDYYNQSLSLKRATSDRGAEAITLNNIGRLYHGFGEPERASDYYAKALLLHRTGGDRYGESSTLYNIARLERDRGNLLEARSRLETSLGLVESLRTQVASQELRASYFASVRQHYDLYVDFLMQMHKQRSTEGLDAVALQASERARARSLLESIAEARADIRQGVDSGLLERERSLQKLLTAKTDRRMRLLSGKPNEAEAAALAREINNLATQFDEVQALIRGKSPHYAALTQPQPLSLSGIQQQVLDENTLLLEYALGDERSYLWAVTPTDITSYELPGSAEIEKAARRANELLVARHPRPGETSKQQSVRVKQAEEEYWQQAAALSQILLGPAAAKLGSKRLLIVTEGALQYLPFGALPVPRANPAERIDPIPLIVEHEIVSLPSVSVLAGLRHETLKRKIPSKTVAVLADPVFETDDPRLLPAQGSGKKTNAANSSALGRRNPSPATDSFRALRDIGMLRDSGPGIPRLLFSRKEAEAIMDVIPQGTGLKAEGFKASREMALNPELGQYKIVHFATHGLLNSEHPELSGIVLSMVDEQGRPQNGFLGLRDIYNLNLPIELVVLSACSTGLGKDVKGEGLVGIVRGFMYAGAARVVASLWKVDDEATAALMKRFYHQMFQGGMPAAAALRAAQIEMWQQKEWRSPYYWAAFVLQGEWK